MNVPFLVIKLDDNLFLRITDPERHRVAHSGVAMWVVMIGNPFDGFKFYGPFATFDEAEEWTVRRGYEDTWWVFNVNEAK